MENAVVDLLAEYAITAYARADAPGVYVNQKKIASLGLRLKHGCCYHGVSLNIDMDLSPFSAIDPCGYRGMEVTQAVDLGISEEKSIISQKLLARLSL
jgi:lipoyl(octanoyl) transferase